MHELRDVQYKYTLQQGDCNKVEWENGDNRKVNLEQYYTQAHSSQPSSPSSILLVTIEDKAFNNKSDAAYPKIIA